MSTILQQNTLNELLLSEFKTNESKWNGSAGSIINKRKKEAFLEFEKTGFPTIKNEEWKYTNLTNLLQNDFSSEQKLIIDQEQIAPFLFNNEEERLIFINGVYRPDLSTIVAQSISIVSFKEADKSVLEKYFAKTSYSKNDPLSSINTALSENGLLITIGKNKAVEKPLFLYFISVAEEKNIFSQPRILIVSEENSHATIVQSFHTLGKHISFSNIVTEIILKEGSNIDCYNIQADTENSNIVATTELYHEAKSISSTTTITLSGGMVRNNLNITLDAEHCEAYMNGLYLLKDNQHVDNHTIADHAKPNCYSNELYKGILDDQSTGVFNGKIFVKPDAQKTNAFQSNKNVLLSKDATINTKPQLEIFADDVKCSHGATIGQMDEESLFYLRSRGIGEDKAKVLLMNAFANDIIEKVKIDSLKEILLHKIEERLQK